MFGWKVFLKFEASIPAEIGNRLIYSNWNSW